jgi:DNA-binding transcriptional ArsR family regulator
MSYNIKILKAIADETRLNILISLLKKEMNVFQITDAVKKSQPNISIALRKLADANLIEARKDQRNVFYKIKNRQLVEKILELVKDG